ncbi:hypothetical protein MUK42_14868 [Musa troglodytarum]|uniref:Uncharacterized protein n=1 Tax=Musa troglodytarum TaxID=320322 RepID=A0A9E7HT71_9LILI|nr:hypothetical protein MUK42_14868 [Musa troglodytarum]
MRFNPILEAANTDKDEEAYDDNKETKDVKREDEFYGLLMAPRARSTGCIDKVLRRSTSRSRVSGILMSVMS